MRRCRCFLLSIAALLSLAAPAQSATLAGKAEISFVATSTLHAFEGKAAPVLFAPADNETGRWSVVVVLSVASLKTGNGWRDGNMRGMLQADRYPVIRAVFAGIDPQTLRTQLTLPFTLTIRHVSRPVTAVLSRWAETDDHLEFDAAFSVSLEEYGLEAPRTLFVHVGDKVAVTVHVVLDRT